MYVSGKSRGVIEYKLAQYTIIQGNLGSFNLYFGNQGILRKSESYTTDYTYTLSIYTVYNRGDGLEGMLHTAMKCVC